ncbi:hypothetical protein ACLOJK_036770 [Asimina triloba]
MRQMNLRKGSLKRLFSVTIGRRNVEEENDKGSDVCPAHGSIRSLEISAGTEQFQRPKWKCFSYQEIFKATNGFHSDNMVGKGGYAEVYRGVLIDGQVIAVKRLTKASADEQKEKEFLTELGTIGHVSHPNILPLLGCCVDNGLHLIFEFSLRGSVSSLLHVVLNSCENILADEKLPPMDWKTRYKIAVGTARGLHYLHQGCQRRIIHRDIKASNILLTADFEPKVWILVNIKHNPVVGYLAPEYFMHGIVDEKTDVFAFGVFLLEIASGRKPAKPMLSEGNTTMLVDRNLGGDYDDQQLQRLAFTASLCIRPSATWRPSMSQPDTCGISYIYGVTTTLNNEKKAWPI